MQKKREKYESGAMLLGKGTFFWSLLSLSILSLFVGHFPQARGDESFPVEKVFESIALPEVSALGLTFEIEHDADNPEYFGGCSLNRPHYSITIGADLVKKPGFTQDAYASILCHELGHLLGGAPRKDSSENSWSSTEGQADYYAASVCMKKMMSATPIVASDLEKLSRADRDLAHALCAGKYPDAPSRDICVRTIDAGVVLLRDIYEWIKYPGLPQPSLDQHAKPLAPGEKINYPSLQCRLDTIVAGALGKPRPACWFSGL
ncbi:MAG: ImmA/IrrE family metallo-endopeptidase [Bdellovibrionia bacterium]